MTVVISAASPEFREKVIITGVKGYFAGGQISSGTYVATADKITFSNDTTAAQASADLSQVRQWLAGLSEGSTKGYFAGGYIIGTPVATADKITFSNDTTAAQTSADLSQARQALAGLSEGSIKGYFAGGYTSTYVATADKITFSNDTTAAQASANLSQARHTLAGLSEGSIKGYFAGGYLGGGAYVATADKVTFSNDTTAAQTSADLSQARQALAGLSEGSIKGYFAGGYTGASYVATVDKITFSNDTTAAQASANLSQARRALAGLSEGSIKGYFAGGQISSGTYVATADKITFSNDTTAAQASANLSQARKAFAGLSDIAL